MNRNYHGSRAAKKNPAPKRFALLLALVLILVGTVGGTVAYLATHTKPVVNTFTPGEVTCKVEETVDNGVKSSVKVQNTGNVPAYIRVAVVANTVDAQGNITGAADENILKNALAASGWTKNGDYYYYNTAVDPNGLTGELLKNSIELDGIQVTILASAIQSTPTDAVQEAWGYVPSAN